MSGQPDEPNLDSPDLDSPDLSPGTKQPAVPSLLGAPQRQLPIAIVAEFFGGSALRNFGEVLIPALIASIATGGRLAFVVLPGAIVVALALVVLRWWRTTFWVEHDELILEKGVLNRTRLQLPLDRVQQIATEQGIIQQLFDVRRVSIDTAGSAGAEFELTAISNDVVAELRRLIVGTDGRVPAAPSAGDLVTPLASPADGATTLPVATHGGSAPDPLSVTTSPSSARSDSALSDSALSNSALSDSARSDSARSDSALSDSARSSTGRSGTGLSGTGLSNAGRSNEIVLRFSFPDLVQVGLVRPGGQLFSAVIALLGFGLGSAIDRFVESRVTSALAIVAFFGAGALFAGVGLIGGAVVRDFDLTVWRSERGLRLTAGLLTKREQFARTERVQLVRQRSNPLERRLGRTTVVLTQASATAATKDTSSGPRTQNFVVPSVPNRTVDQLTSMFIVDPPTDLTGSVAPHARWRWFLYGGIWPAAMFAAYALIVILFDGPLGLAATLIGCAAITMGLGFVIARASQRRWRWQVEGTAPGTVERATPGTPRGVLLSTRHGVLVEQRDDVEVRKIQSVSVERGWWQRRNGLASIICSTAGGNVSIPHLDVAVAESMRDRLLAIVEQNEGPWM